MRVAIVIALVLAATAGLAGRRAPSRAGARSSSRGSSRAPTGGSSKSFEMRVTRRRAHLAGPGRPPGQVQRLADHRREVDLSTTYGKAWTIRANGKFTVTFFDDLNYDARLRVTGEFRGMRPRHRPGDRALGQPSAAASGGSRPSAGADPARSARRSSGPRLTRPAGPRRRARRGARRARSRRAPPACRGSPRP